MINITCAGFLGKDATMGELRDGTPVALLHVDGRRHGGRYNAAMKCWEVPPGWWDDRDIAGVAPLPAPPVEEAPRG